MKNFFIAFCIITLVLLSACGRKIITPAIIEKTIVKDSIVERVRDSVVTIPPDSAWIKALLECDSLGQVHLKQLLSYKSGANINPPVVTVKENVLTALSKTDSINIYLRIKDRYQYATTDNTKYEKEIIEVNRLTKWQGFQIILGKIFAILLLLLLGFGAYKTYKKLRP